MSVIQQVEVGSTKYNVTPASAMDQKKLMLLVGARVALNSATGQVGKIDENMLLGTLLSMPEDKFDQISNICLHKTMVHGGETLVTGENFGGAMMDYFLLISKAIKVNLDDFFTYLDKINAEARAVSKQESQV